MATARADSELIDRVVAEYEALRGRRVSSRYSLVAVGGKVEHCGPETGPGSATICYVPTAEDGVLPLAVGDPDTCIERLAAIDQGQLPFWDPRFFAPPVAIVDGVRRRFRPMRGSHVIGVVEAPGRVLLLAALGEEVAVIQLVGKARTVVHSGRPLTFNEINVDRAIRGHRAQAAPPRPIPRVRPSTRVRGYHLKIAGAVAVDVGEGPSIETVLERGLRVLGWRARTVKLASPQCKRRGKTKLRRVLDAFYKVILGDGGIFEGSVGELLDEVQDRCRDLDVGVETFSNILGLLHAAGTCLVQRPTTRDWRLCLSADLRDPTTELHRRFCEETVEMMHALVAAGGLAEEEGPSAAANEPGAAARPRGRRSPRARAGGASASTSTGDPAAQEAASAKSRAGDGPTRSSSSEPPPAPPPAADEPAPAAQPAEPRAASDGSLTANDSTDVPAMSDDPPTAGAAPTTAPESAASTDSDANSTEPAPDDASSQAEDACADPERAARSLISLVMTISATIEAEPDPRARERYELTFTSAMFKQFSREDAVPGIVAEWTRRFAQVDPIGAAAGPAKYTSPGASADAAGPVGAAAAPSNFAAEVEPDLIDPREPAGVTDAVAVERGESMPDAVEGPPSSHAEMVEPDLAVDDDDDAGSVDEGDDRVADLEDSAAADAPTAAEHRVSHVPLVVLEGDHDAPEASETAALLTRNIKVTEPSRAVGEVEAREGDLCEAGALDGSSNAESPAGGSARCDARPRPTASRRPLFAPNNCVVLHTQGWAAPLVVASPVPLTRLAVLAPYRGPPMINDDTCAVSITTAAPEIAQESSDAPEMEPEPSSG